MGVTGLAGGVLSAELCAPLLLLCWLCCWPDDANSDSTSGKHPQRPVLAHVHESGTRCRSSDVFGRRIGSSAVSLHLPSTSGYKKPLSAHRSHEEIGARRKWQHEAARGDADSSEPGTAGEARYHSAPSVIDEVLHRRDWERSTKDLYIPLKPQPSEQPDCDLSSSDESERAPHAEPESSSIEAKSEEHIPSRVCKKHYTNIKSSRGRKERHSRDIKDSDATESSFYIGDNREEDTVIKNNEETADAVLAKSIYKAKDAKQSFNEFIRSKERPRNSLAPVDEARTSLGFCLDDVISRLDTLDTLDTLDRSGAQHHTIESRISLHRLVYPPPSVEPVGYEGGACYLEARAAGGGAGPGGSVPAGGGLRPRHASDGDILAPPHRPESGAFSESDLDLELEESEERPPPYDELHHYTHVSNVPHVPPSPRAPRGTHATYATHDHKETAI